MFRAKYWGSNKNYKPNQREGTLIKKLSESHQHELCCDIFTFFLPWLLIAGVSLGWSSSLTNGWKPRERDWTVEMIRCELSTTDWCSVKERGGEWIICEHKTPALQLGMSGLKSGPAREYMINKRNQCSIQRSSRWARHLPSNTLTVSFDQWWLITDQSSLIILYDINDQWLLCKVMCTNKPEFPPICRDHSLLQRTRPGVDFE